MTDAVWTFFGTIGASIIAGIVAIIVVVIKIVIQLFGKKDESSIRELLESYHKSNSTRIDTLERNQKELETTVEEGFKNVKVEIEEVRNIVMVYHPKQA